ncbi:MAG: hypothetical protein IJH12_04040 [Clostridia bacterium]|nr:hypothetical protein [Clostridia bacterium]
MANPKIISASWVMTRTDVDSYGEELWNLVPNKGSWIAIIHLQKETGKMYLSIVKAGGRTSSMSNVDQKVVVAALRKLSQMVYKEQGIKTQIGVKATEKNAKLFATVRKAGFRKTGIRLKNRHKPDTLVYKFNPDRAKK